MRWLNAPKPLAGDDLGCEAICPQSRMGEMLGLPVMDRTPAPQLKTIRLPSPEWGLLNEIDS